MPRVRNDQRAQLIDPNDGVLGRFTLVFDVRVLGALFIGNNVKRVILTNDALEFVPDFYDSENNRRINHWLRSGAAHRYSLADLQSTCRCLRGVWSELHFYLKNGQEVVARGISNRDAERLVDSFHQQKEIFDRSQELLRSLDQLRDLRKSAEQILARQVRIRSSVITSLESQIPACALKMVDWTLLDGSSESIRSCRNLFQNLGTLCTEHNLQVDRRQNAELIRRRAAWLESKRRELERLACASEYVRSAKVIEFANSLSTSTTFWSLDVDTTGEDANISYFRLRNFLSNTESWRVERNNRFLSDEINRTRAFFESVDSGLTLEQRTAAIVDETRLRIIAGAGTGKTTTLFAKAAYLAEQQHVRPSDILAITYSRKSRSDLIHRFDQRVSTAGANIQTIHALGCDIVGRARKAKPSLAPWVESEQAFATRCKAYFANVFADPALASHAAYFAILNEQEVKPGYAFDDSAQYFDYIRRVKCISLRGEELKSVQEVYIANFLYIFGVAYEYEARYKVATASAAYAQYKPDFYLPEYDIYLEHYGISREGNTAPGIDRDEYAAHMAWKRDTHAKNATTCIETFSYQASEGTLLDNLQAALLKHGVEFRVIDGSKILQDLSRSGKVSKLSTLLKEIIALWKERDSPGLSLEDAFKANAFLAKHAPPVLGRLMALYEEDLKVNRFVDYSDMILEAQRLIADGNLTCDYKVVLLDEAQDLSPARARLIASYVRSKTDVRFTAVGDDWQSIYRFAGSKLGTFLDFEKSFGPGSLTLQLSETHRFNESIERPTSEFVSRNPRQTQRRLMSASTDKPALHFIEYPFGTEDQSDFALQQLAGRYDLTNKSIFFVYRTKFDAPRNIPRLSEAYPQCKKIWADSIHSSKGIEADFVIVLEANETWNGIPSTRPGDPLIEPLLPEAESFALAEDRRLFYVACTRGKLATTVCFRRRLKRPFVDELIKCAPLSTLVLAPDAKEFEDGVECRSCRVGYYVPRINEKGKAFAGCSQFPACRETAPLCPACGGIVSMDHNNNYVCSACEEFIGEACPECRRGWVVTKPGRYSDFEGCSRWRSDRMGCSFRR